VDHADADNPDSAGTWFVGILSFRAICSAVMMFGLAGLSAQRMYEPATSFLIAAGCGVAVLFGVAYMLKTLYGFASDGTVRDEDAIGMTGNVYLTIPGKNQGKGKVTIFVKGRTMEYDAMTDGENLPTGTAILVVDVPSPDVLAVVRDDETPISQGTNHA
jgi:F0F1-type ATP synthase membrane subunit c/vacuolar-type H+-ATPase subunit K